MAKKKAPKKKMVKKATRKTAPRKAIPKKKAAPKKAARKAVAKKTAAKKQTAPRKVAAKKPAPKAVAPKKTAPKKPPTSAPRPRAPRQKLELDQNQRGLGSAAAGQSGDLQGLRRKAEDDSESVEELVQEGQSWEAAALSGVEDADGEPREVHTHEVREDDVPEEYLDDDRERE